MTRHIQSHPLFVYLEGVDFYQKNSFFLHDRFQDVSSIWPNHTTATFEKELIRFALQVLRQSKLRRDVFHGKQLSGCHDKTAPLYCIMLAGQLMQMMNCRPNSHMHMLSRLMEGHPGMRHPMFPAYESPRRPHSSPMVCKPCPSP